MTTVATPTREVTTATATEGRRTLMRARSR
jgi:hypothetical protein